MKNFRKHLKEIMISGGVLATVIGVFLTYYTPNPPENTNKGDNNSVNFNGETHMTDNNISGGQMTVYENSENLEKTNQSQKVINKEIDETEKKSLKTKINQEPKKSSNGATNNIANSNVANIIIVKSEDIKKLVDYYKFQAEEIRNKLLPLYCFAPIEEFILNFEELHNSHITALNNQNLVLASKYLQKIHRISSILEFKEGQLEKDYQEKFEDSLGLLGYRVEYLKEYEPKGVYGSMANKYITGEFVPYSKLSIEWPIPEEYEGYLDSIQRIQYRQQVKEFYQALSRKKLLVD